jgi:hypothetical protein
VLADVDESSFGQFWVDATERLRMRMGGWKADAGGTTLGMAVPALDDVTTT